MARHHNRDGVAPVGGAHRAHGLGRADSIRHKTVAAGFAVGNVSQLPPHPRLKLGALHIQSQIEVPQFSGEVGAQLLHGLPQQRVCLALATGQFRGAIQLDGPDARIRRHHPQSELAGSFKTAPFHASSLTSWRAGNRAGSRLLAGQRALARLLLPSCRSQVSRPPALSPPTTQLAAHRPFRDTRSRRTRHPRAKERCPPQRLQIRPARLRHYSPRRRRRIIQAALGRSGSRRATPNPYRTPPPGNHGHLPMAARAGRQNREPHIRKLDV